MFSSPAFAEECIRKQNRSTQFTIIVSNYEVPEERIAPLKEYGLVLFLRADDLVPQKKSTEGEQKAIFPKDYSVEQLDKGIDMQFHPHTGELLSDLKFDATIFFHVTSPVGWGEAEWERRERISNGGPCSAGDPYPVHWQYDPWTGKTL